MLNGIDISAHQSTTPSLAGLAFVGIRATIADRVDTMYATHLAAASDLVTIAYHFNWSTLPVAAQADLFLATAKDADLLALDVELNDDRHGTITPAFSKAQAAEFIARVHAAGRTIGLYHSDSGFFDAGQDWNWVAKWSTTPPSRAWAFWQHRGSPLDLDYFNGDQAALDRLAGRDMAKITAYVRQNWTANGTNGVLRLEPIRATNPVETLSAGTPIESFAELEEVTPAGINYWRAASWPYGSRNVFFFLRAGPGIARNHDFLAGGFVTDTALIAAATAPLEKELEITKDKLTSANAELAVAKTKISAARSALS